MLLLIFITKTLKAMKKQENKDLNKTGKDDKTAKKDPNQKPHMKKPGEKGFIPQNEYIGDGSAGMGGTSGI
jgi:hypothetical protein